MRLWKYIHTGQGSNPQLTWPKGCEGGGAAGIGARGRGMRDCGKSRRWDAGGGTSTMWGMWTICDGLLCHGEQR